MAHSFVQKSKQNKQQILLEQQHQIIKDLSTDLKNCEAREKVLIGSNIDVRTIGTL
jgi:hypothetical protein